MRFFTPELFVELNSPDEDVVDRAEEKWEVGDREYQAYFKSIEANLPAPLVKLCKSVPLHGSRIDRPAQPVLTVYETDDSGAAQLGHPHRPA